MPQPGAMGANGRRYLSIERTAGISAGYPNRHERSLGFGSFCDPTIWIWYQMDLVSEQVKKYALAGFAIAGIDRLAFSLHARDALILVYHSILKEEKGEPFGYHHTVAEFEAHLDWLGARCTPVGLADFARWKSGAWQPRKPPVLITFDDGYRNNATLAAPLLVRKGFPALFCITTGYIGRDRVLWADEVFSRILAWTGPSLHDPNGAVYVIPEIAGGS